MFKVDTSHLWYSSLPDRSLSDTVVEDTETTYEVVENGTKRGAKKLVTSTGYSYTVKRGKDGGKITWTCSIRNKTTNCAAGVYQRGEEFVDFGEHAHQPNPGVAKKVKVTAKVKQDATADVFKPALKIVEDNWRDMIDDDDFNLVKPDSLKRVANRFRQGKRPKEPLPTDLLFEINREYLDADDFLQAEVVVGDHRHVILATERQLEMLRTSKRWFMDGTFKILRKPFRQLWSIHTFIHKGDAMKQIPLVFVLMTNKATEDYVAVLERIRELAGGVTVTAGTMDFEPGAWTACRQVFPGIQLQGCVFHWVQCVWRKVQEYGLQPTYNARRSTYDYIRRCMALPFLPHQHMTEAFRLMEGKANTEELRRLVSYMRDTWFTSNTFPVECLSVFNLAIRTNNDVEGWHRRINKRANGQGLGFYVLVPFLRQEAELIQHQVRLVQDNLYTRDNRQKYCRVQQRLNSIWTRYLANDLSTADLLKEAAKMYGEL